MALRATARFDVLLGGAARPQPDAPQAARIVLRLHGALPGHDLGRVLKRRTRNVLIREALRCDVHVA